MRFFTELTGQTFTRKQFVDWICKNSPWPGTVESAINTALCDGVIITGINPKTYEKSIKAGQAYLKNIKTEKELKEDMVKSIIPFTREELLAACRIHGTSGSGKVLNAIMKELGGKPENGKQVINCIRNWHIKEELEKESESIETPKVTQPEHHQEDQKPQPKQLDPFYTPDFIHNDAILNNNIKKIVSADTVELILDGYNQKGKFIYKDESTYIALDSTGETVVTNIFQDVLECIEWLKNPNLVANETESVIEEQENVIEPDPVPEQEAEKPKLSMEEIVALVSGKGIMIISPEEVDNIVTNGNPEGLFIAVESDETFTAIDNHSGPLFTHGFESIEDAIEWLIHPEQTDEELEHYEQLSKHGHIGDMLYTDVIGGKESGFIYNCSKDGKISIYGDLENISLDKLHDIADELLEVQQFFMNGVKL